jgi:hypothetical protein
VVCLIEGLRRLAMADEQPSLGQLIWLVRRELEWARQVDEDQPLRFDVGVLWSLMSMWK